MFVPRRDIFTAGKLLLNTGSGEVKSMFGRLGTQELLVILALVLIIFGPRKLPEIGRSLGKGLREFKQATNEIKESINLDEKEETKDSKPAESPETKEA
jgi:sec-independent protein translocase protein TatA